MKLVQMSGELFIWIEMPPLARAKVFHMAFHLLVAVSVLITMPAVGFIVVRGILDSIVF